MVYFGCQFLRVDNTRSKAENSIGKFFNTEASSMVDRHEKSGVPQTAIKQVQDIVSSNAKKVVDVGSGPGSVMIEFLKKGTSHVTGVDLSPEMNNTATKRIHEAGYSDEQFSLIQGSFLDIDSVECDAVSMHRVICCHPDKQAMIEKSTSLNPEVISITVPRTWIFFRLVTAVFGIVAKFRSSFRPYIHSQKYIDREYRNLGYELMSRKKTLGWVQSTYKKIDQS